MYDTYQAGGWYEAGGTSTSAPLIAGVYGLAGNASSMSNPAQTLWYDRAIGAGCLFNVPSGTSAQYAYQSGLGSPNSTGCF
jgi:hypothetical protein